MSKRICFRFYAALVIVILSSSSICVGRLFGQSLPEYAPGSLIIKFTTQAMAQPIQTFLCTEIEKCYQKPYLAWCCFTALS